MNENNIQSIKYNRDNVSASGGKDSCMNFNHIKFRVMGRHNLNAT